MAADDPARWSPWVAPCPIKASEVTRKKAQARVKARMDQRTRTQLPLLPALLRAVEQHRRRTHRDRHGHACRRSVHCGQRGVPALPPG
jgi:hypothetical protein